MKDQWGHEVVDSGTQRLRAELTELQEAVRWERKAASIYNLACSSPDYGTMVWATENLEKARAAVDALIGEK